MTQRKVSCFLSHYDRHAQTCCHTTNNSQWACHQNPARKSLLRKLELCLRYRISLPFIFLLVPFYCYLALNPRLQKELQPPRQSHRHLCGAKMFLGDLVPVLVQEVNSRCLSCCWLWFTFLQPTATWRARRSYLWSQWPRHQYCSPDTGMQLV